MPFDFFKDNYISINNFDGALHYPFVFNFKGINALLGAHTVDVLLSGVSPLTLLNAVKLTYIKAFGKCEQGADVIVCNNGTIKAKDDELPVGYRRLFGISFDGNSYYETNQTLFGTDTLTLRIANTTSSGRNVIGAYSGTGDEARNFSLYIYGGGSSSTSYLRHGTNLARPRYGTGARTLVMSPTGTDGFLVDVTYPQEDFETTSTCWIGGLPNSSSPKFDGNINGNITVSDRLKYIPCERVSDGAIGYYETVNGEFLENQGTGTVTAVSGYDTSHLVAYIDVTDQETITIDTTGSSATCQNLLSAGTYKDVQNITNGQVTHNLGILVLTGNEDWRGESGVLYADVFVGKSTNNGQEICSHYTYDGSPMADMANDTFKVGSSSYPNRIYIKDTVNGGSATALNNYLKAQYVAGTPVIVIYPLATPTTETVAGQTLTITQGTNVVTASGAASDLELEISYKGYAEVTVEEIAAVNTDESVEITIG